MKIFITSLVVLVFAAACSPITATYDIDKNVNFSQFKTYNFTEEAKKLGIQQMDRDRILNAVDREMAERGFTKSDNPDALVDIYVRLEEKRSATATSMGSPYGYGYGMGMGHYGYGGGFSTTQINVNEYIEGTLFVNFVDMQAQKIVWQGRGTKTLDEKASGEKKEKNINYGVDKIFQKFPVKPVDAKK